MTTNTRANAVSSRATYRGGYAGRPRIAVTFAVLTLTVLTALAVVSAQGQGLPPWVDDNRRAAMYPLAEWHVGFTMVTVRSEAELPNAIRHVENEARKKLAEGITVRIQATTTTQTSARQTSGTGVSGLNETIRRSYGQMVEASTDAEVGKVEVVTYHDRPNNRVYALARVKKADLAAYYVSRIEFYLQLAENEFRMARQFAESERKRSALERTAEAKKNIEESGKYKELLSVVDFRGDIRRLLDKSAALERDIAAFEMNLQDLSPPIFITGREIVDNSETDIALPALRSLFSENGCRVTNNREEAGHILTVEVTNCLTSRDENFSYCYACVRADLVNVRTGRSEAKINFTGPKEGWTTMGRACRNAFGKAAEAMWGEVREKTEICR